MRAGELMGEDGGHVWTEEAAAEFKRRRRGRNIALLIAMLGLVALIYAIALVKLLESGHMW